MALNLDLNKAAQNLTLSLQKAGIVTPPRVDLAFDLDVSGSFDDEHRQGLTNQLLVRLVPWAMVFDPDKKLEVFTFSNGANHATYVGEVTPDNCEGYVKRQIIGKVPGYNGGTDYSYVLELNLQHFGWKPSGTEKKGFFSKLFGGDSAPATAAVEKKRSIVIFVTDGENTDKTRTESIIADSEARKDGVYFLFLGVSNQNAKFPFIDKLGERFSNIGFVPINNVAQWVAKSDDEINQALLGDELIEWLKA